MPIDAALPLVCVRGLCIALLGTVLAGCTKQTTEKPTGQVVANVNGTEITYLQLNHLLQTGGIAASTDEAKRGAVDTLIERELLMQEALEAKLDRDTDVLQALDTAKRQILIDAYAQRLIYPKAVISESEKKTYYEAHPELFENRRAYALAVFNVDRTAVTPEVLSALETATTIDAVRQVLDAHHVRYIERKGEQSAEQLPLSMVKQFSEAKVGDIIVASQDESTNLMLITTAEVKPVQFAEAAAMIEQYLISTRNGEAMQARVKQLRESARIAYAEQFSGTKSVVRASASASQ